MTKKKITKKKINELELINTKKIQKTALKEIEAETIEEYKEEIKNQVKQKVKEIKMAKIVVERLENELETMLNKNWTEEELLFNSK